MTTTYFRVPNEAPELEDATAEQLRKLVRFGLGSVQRDAADELKRRDKQRTEDALRLRCAAIARECMGLHNPPDDLMIALAVAYRAGSSSRR